METVPAMGIGIKNNLTSIKKKFDKRQKRLDKHQKKFARDSQVPAALLVLWVLPDPWSSGLPGSSGPVVLRSRGPLVPWSCGLLVLRVLLSGFAC